MLFKKAGRILYKKALKSKKTSKNKKNKNTLKHILFYKHLDARIRSITNTKKHFRPYEEKGRICRYSWKTKRRKIYLYKYAHLREGLDY